MGNQMQSSGGGDKLLLIINHVASSSSPTPLRHVHFRLCHDRPNLVLRLGVLGSQSVSDALSTTLVSASAMCDATQERSPDARTPVSSDRSRLNIVPLYMQIYTHPFAKIKCIVLRGYKVVIHFFIPPMTIFLADSKCKYVTSLRMFVRTWGQTCTPAVGGL